MARRNLFWTPKREAKLRKLYAEGLSYTLMSKQIAGSTRCSVAGAVYRFGLKRPATVKRSRKPRPYGPSAPRVIAR